MLERAAKQGQMENKVEDISGNSASNGESMGKFGRLTVLSVVREKGKKAVAICACDCGNMKSITFAHIKNGGTKSCGCLRSDTSKETGRLNKTHGQSVPEHRTAAYRSWECMKSRCRNPSDPSYKDYGARGVVYADDWESFDVFFKDMGERPRGKTLNRINNAQGYNKTNCEWATVKIQQRNKRNNRMVLFKEKEITLVELSEITGVPYQRLHERIVRRGWSVDDAINKPSRAW